MTFIANERVREVSISTGTGDFTLAGADTSYQTFFGTAATGNIFNYRIDAGNEWETGVGKMTNATTLNRFAVIQSSNADLLVNFSAATKQVTMVNTHVDSHARAIEWFGDGNDGDVSIGSGTTNLSSEVQYRNLTISGTAVLVTQAYRVCVSSILTLTSAGTQAILHMSGNGGGSGGAPGGSGNPGSFITTDRWLGMGGTGLIGGTGGSSGGGNVATPTAAMQGSMGGQGGAGGAGGSGSSGAGGASVAGGVRFGTFNVHLLQRDALGGGNVSGGALCQTLRGGSGGAGGSGGGGDGTTAGGGGGGGGGAVPIWISARVISRGGSTSQGSINAVGGFGGAGGTPAAGNRGGGGGAGGGGGGWVYLIYESLVGSTATNMIDVSGGASGAGGTRTGTGVSGNGGTGGGAGRVTLIDLGAGTITESIGAAGSAGGAGSGGTPGTAGAIGTLKVNL